MKNSHRQPWLHSAVYDGFYILSPAFVSLAAVMLLPARYRETDIMPIAAWVFLVLMIDVAHVYSTLFRTYMNPERLARQKVLYTVVPVACYLGGVLLYSLGALVFWRTLAYLAVFHFIRQQYGFMRIYSRTENAAPWMKTVDTFTIYYATLYPIIYWHCTPVHHFNWFTEGDFFEINAPWLLPAASVLYGITLLAYAVKELLLCSQTKTLNIPRNLVIAGTLVSWYAGIVYFNGDLSFTLLNVVAHGVPYMALVWLSARREADSSQRSHLYKQIFFRPAGILIFFAIILGLAYLEEGLWDGLVWSEHQRVFSLFTHLPIVQNDIILSLLVPLLSLPQMTHYTLDGFIWRRKDH